MGSVCFFVFVVVVVFLVCRFCSFETAQYGPYTSLFLEGGGRGNGEQLGWFVLIRIRNTKPWNHFHMCTVVLWAKIVVEFMLLWSGLQRKEDSKQNAMRVAVNVSASIINNLLCEIVSRYGFASACEYCISSSSNVSNL